MINTMYSYLAAYKDKILSDPAELERLALSRLAFKLALRSIENDLEVRASTSRFELESEQEAIAAVAAKYEGPATSECVPYFHERRRIVACDLRDWLTPWLAEKKAYEEQKLNELRLRTIAKEIKER